MIFYIMTFVLAVLQLAGVIDISYWYIAAPAIFITSIYALLTIVGALFFVAGVKADLRKKLN